MGTPFETPENCDVIPYHGLPITPDAVALEAVARGHAFCSFAHPGQLGLALEACQSVAFDNGAFPAWRRGEPIRDWHPYYAWIGNVMKHPRFDWAVIPDVIDGDEKTNDALIDEWPLPRHLGVPVWHMHESYSRLIKLCAEWPRVALGSSGEFATVGNAAWWHRMNSALMLITDVNRFPVTKLHGLRMLNPKIFTRIPLSSADSTNIGRNVGVDKKWTGSYPPANKMSRAAVMRARIEVHNSSATWDGGFQ